MPCLAAGGGLAKLKAVSTASSSASALQAMIPQVMRRWAMQAKRKPGEARQVVLRLVRARPVAAASGVAGSGAGGALLDKVLPRPLLEGRRVHARDFRARDGDMPPPRRLPRRRRCAVPGAWPPPHSLWWAHPRLRACPGCHHRRGATVGRAPMICHSSRRHHWTSCRYASSGVPGRRACPLALYRSHFPPPSVGSRMGASFGSRHHPSSHLGAGCPGTPTSRCPHRAPGRTRLPIAGVTLPPRVH